MGQRLRSTGVGWGACALLLLCLPPSLWAQVATPPPGVVVAGRVLDEVTAAELPAARVRLLDLGTEVRLIWEGVTGADGRFQSARVPAGSYEIRVEILGYLPLIHPLELGEHALLDLQIELLPNAVELEELVVTATRRPTRLEASGFLERRSAGLGYFLDRSEIEGRNPFRVSDLFYGVPGARVVRVGRGNVMDVRLRQNCVPQVVLNGNPIALPIVLDELLSVAAIEAIEVYHGGAGPVQSLRSNCGTIMVWTRDEGGADGAPFSWKRLAAALIVLGTLVFITR